MSKCMNCGKEISGIQIFGESNAPLCWDCFSDIELDTDNHTYYGLAPHEHKIDASGTITTHFLNVTPNINGEITVGGWHFTPDPEESTLGVWYK